MLKLVIIYFMKLLINITIIIEYKKLKNFNFKNILIDV